MYPAYIVANQATFVEVINDCNEKSKWAKYPPLRNSNFFLTIGKLLGFVRGYLRYIAMIQPW